MNFSQLFDVYGRNARLKPSLLALFPLIVTIAIWFPDLYTLAKGLLSVAIACGVIFMLADYARSQGRAIEQRFYRKWGGKPTTILFRHNDGTIDALTKERYASFLSQYIKGWTRPTPEEEAHNPAAADQLYESATRWLLEYTRDKKMYALLFDENITYGFRRNIYGLKPFGLIISVLSLLINAAAIYVDPSFKPTHVCSTVISFAAVTAWLLIVSEIWVRDAANAYAVRLLAACEQKNPAAPKRQSTKRPPKKTDSPEELRPEKA